MSGSAKALLDTDTLSFLQRGHPAVVRIASTYLGDHGRFTISQVTRYEIVRGLLASNASSQLALFENACARMEILPLSWSEFELAAQLWATLNAKGQLIKDADLLIGATALNHGLALVTHNTSHFARIPGLNLEDWVR